MPFGSVNSSSDTAAAGARPDFDRLRRATPARLQVGRAGAHYTTAAWLRFRADHARAVDAVMIEVSRAWPRRHGMREVRSRAASRQQFLLRPELGRRLREEDARRLRGARPKAAGHRTVAARAAASARSTVLLCVGDGLSSAAVERNAAPLIRALRRRLAGRYRLLAPLFIRNARVRVQDHLGELLRPDLVCLLIGERPGLATAESLSAYVIWRPRLGSSEPDRTVISNIHLGGLKIPAAAARIARLIDDAARHQASGATLAQILARGE